MAFYDKKRVLVTGHTGFKGAWLCEWLLKLGAEVSGYALEPPTDPALFTQLGLAPRLARDERGDVRDLDHLERVFAAVHPQIVFHLAAQPIVLTGYACPRETFETNVMGTVNVLEAARRAFHGAAPESCRLVCITTDKVYANDDSAHPFRETDALGGNDPYSASKGACEIAIQSYRRSFFATPEAPVWVASARAGNVIGGGDWAADRLVPDAFRAWRAGRTLTTRNANATRPWQHVLEPLAGYLTLGAAPEFATFATAYNFGPSAASVKTVGELVTTLARFVPDARVNPHVDEHALPEATHLALDSTKAQRRLGWMPHWDFETTLRHVAAGYLTDNLRAEVAREIDAFTNG